MVVRREEGRTTCLQPGIEAKMKDEDRSGLRDRQVGSDGSTLDGGSGKEVGSEEMDGRAEEVWGTTRPQAGSKQPGRKERGLV